MRGTNQTHYVGSLALTPELKYTPGGLAILEITVAGRGEVLTADGTPRQAPFYNRCKAFGKYAESLAESLSQGDVVSVHGRLEYRSYEIEGEKRSAVETVVATLGTLAGRFVTQDDARGQPVLQDGLNRVTIGGNLTKDAELKRLPTGNSVVRLSLAVNERYAEDGEKVGYFDLQAWGELAEGLAEGAKGQGVVGVGRLLNDSWTDPSGTKRYGTRVELERAYLVAGAPAKPEAVAGAATPPARETAPPVADLPF